MDYACMQRLLGEVIDGVFVLLLHAKHQIIYNNGRVLRMGI